MILPSISKRSIRNLVVFAGVLAAVVGLMVVPSYFAIGKTEAELDKIKAEVDEQRQLAPVFGKLLEKRRELNSAKAKMPVRSALARDKAGGVADEVTGIARKNRMRIVGLTSDLNALVNETRLMQVDMVLRGGISDFSGFLDEIIAVPHIEFIERVRITAIPEGREYGLRVWVALK